MLPRADLSANRPPGSVEAPTRATSATDTRQEIFRRLNQIAIGKELIAIVRAKLDDGTHLVKLGDAQARMALPVGTKVGDQLSMVFVAREPRPTFLLTGQPGSASTSLSTAARLIDHLLQRAPQDGAEKVIQGRVPLLASATPEPAQLAFQLRQALSGSGLFYEAHLHEWISGARTLPEVLREPQAGFPAARPGTQQSAAPDQPRMLQGHELNRIAAGLRELGEGAQALVRLLRETQRQGTPALNVDADLVARPQPATPPLDPELARLIQQQINTLEQQHVRWQGQLWPGQQAEWDVTEERSSSDPENRDASSWSSVVRFELPHLGALEARVRLSGEHVQVQVIAPDDSAIEWVREHIPLLDSAMEAAGVALDALLVRREDEHEAP